MTRQVLEHAGPGVDATITLDEARKVELNFEFNRLKSIQNTESLSYTAQAIKGNKLGIARSTRPGDAASTLDRAIRLTEYGAPVEYGFPEPAPAARPNVYSEDLAALSLERMIETGSDLARFLKALHPDINGSVTIGRSVVKESVANTKGLDASWEKTILVFGASANLVEGQNLVSIYEYCASTGLDLDLETLKERLGRKFALARKNVRVETGSYDVLFTPRGFRDLLSPIIACLDGKAVARGISPFDGRLGEQVFSPALTIVEDGTMDGGTGSRMYDEQGVACARTPLVQKGVLREYLLDIGTAKKLGRSPIGTGGPNGIRPNNLLAEGGEVSKDSLLAGMKRGIVIENTMGAWAGNPYSGQVNGNISMGFWVIDGKPVGRVKDCMFSANAFTHLKDNLVALSRETKDVFGITAPYALVSNVSVTAKNE